MATVLGTKDHEVNVRGQILITRVVFTDKGRYCYLPGVYTEHWPPRTGDTLRVEGGNLVLPSGHYAYGDVVE